MAVEVNSLLNKMLKSKKGISPILTTLLIIVIAVAAAIVTWAWVMTFTRTQTQQASAILAEENVRFYNLTTVRDGLQVTIRNIGSADTRIDRIYLGTSSANLIDVTANASDLGTGKALFAHSALTITISWPNLVGTTEWQPSTTYYFKVAPESGASFEFSKRSPA